MISEKRIFTTSPELLWDVVSRQAGTVEKALMEIVQNSIDAQSKCVNITITQEKIVAKDDGIGMNKEEILKHFEVFGQTFKRGDESYLGAFGMGRGQVFSKGNTKWYTQNFVMLVDIKKNGLTYELIEENKSILGTLIEVKLYNKVKFLDKKIERFIEWVKYVQDVDIIVNGNKINEKLEFDFEDAKGMVKVVENDAIHVYNRGIFVKEDKIGTGAIIISKKNLKVNFARNDIMDDCEVFNHLLDKTKNLFKDKLLEKQSLSHDDRKTIINLMKEDDKWIDTFKDKAIVETANHNFISIKEVEKQKEIFFSDGKNSYEDDKLIQHGHLVLKDNWIVKGILNKAIGLTNRVGDYQELLKDFRGLFQEHLNEKDLSVSERMVFEEFKKLNDSMKINVRRKLLIAKNMVSLASTDGKFFITLNKKLLHQLNYDFMKYVLTHEYAHDTDTLNTDEHGYEFYEKFYKLVEANSNGDN